MTSRNLLMSMACIAFAGSVTAVKASADNEPESTLTVGVGAQNTPAYSGSNKRHTNAIPVIQARKGAVFFDSIKGIGYDLQSDNGLYLEHTLGYRLGRTEKNSNWRDGSDQLKGMGKIKGVLDTSLAVGWQASPWLSLEGKATLPLTDGQGGQYETSVTWVPWQNKNDIVAFETAALFGDDRDIKTFYGVSNEQSANSGYARYQPAGGLYGVENDLTWSHQFTPHWSTLVDVGYTWLTDRAADSPIVFRRDQVSTSAAVLYTF